MNLYDLFMHMGGIGAGGKGLLGGYFSGEDDPNPVEQQQQQQEPKDLGEIITNQLMKQGYKKQKPLGNRIRR